MSSTPTSWAAHPLARKARRGLQILVTPRLLKEQIEYLRHGPADGDDAQARGSWPVIPASPWSVLDEQRVVCNLCGWRGAEFPENLHAEYGLCRRCGSSARERFLFRCLTACVPAPAAGAPRLRLLETSPRLAGSYPEAMATWFDYVASDFDERAHRAAIRLDLQAIDLPDASLDVVMTAHVLEHVPDTDRALRELFRVVRPGGSLLLQVPVQQGATSPPPAPEFHGDDTPVFWRFGFDLADRLRGVGFEVATLCLEELAQVVDAGAEHWPAPWSSEFDMDSVLEGAQGVPLTAVVSTAEADLFGLHPAYMLIAWHARRPA